MVRGQLAKKGFIYEKEEAPPVQREDLELDELAGSRSNYTGLIRVHCDTVRHVDDSELVNGMTVTHMRKYRRPLCTFP